MSKYSERVMRNVRQTLDLDENDTSRDNEIMEMNQDIVFRRFLEWEGILGYDETILNAIESIYDVELI